MKIIKLTAENVKRLKAVEINPDGTVQIVTGRNAQGKTSVLDAIWLALGGGAAGRETTRPIRDGEETARVLLDLGDLSVERTWKGDKTSLTVKAADGAKYSGPQGILDDLVGRLSFDPLEFTRRSARDQVAALLDLVDLDVDLDALAEKRQILYDERTQVGRDGKALGDPPAWNESLSADEVSVTELAAKARAGYETNRLVADSANRLIHAQARMTNLEAEIKDARAELVEAEKENKEVERVDVDALDAAVDAADETNATIRANNAALKTRERIVEMREKYGILTGQIDHLDRKRTDALATAKFPVDGLGFDDDGVTYNGVPFLQSSSAERIRVSLAMAMALNPKLRVIRIMDGSLLDDENMAMVTEMAADADYQVWIERVSDSSAAAVVIEDGQVAS